MANVSANKFMDISLLIENKVVFGILSAIGGIVLAALTQQFLNRRQLFTYNVFHSRIGISADDAIYGSVKVTWNDNPVAHLYLSTIEVINQSGKDFENVELRIFTNDCLLLSQRTEIVGTSRLIDFTDEYQKRIAVAPGEQPNQQQFDLFRSQRDFVAKTMNRGQLLRFQFLTAARTEAQPTIWADVLHKGVKCIYRVPKSEFMGVPHSDAALAGSIVGLLIVGFTILYIESLPLAAAISFVAGWTVLIPGALAIKALRKARVWFTG